MIPITLAIKNFMCYRENVPVLDLEQIHVACLSGNNGHGKTAILDAITWVLWGQSRSRTQDALVYQGQLDMSVNMVFLARGQKYHVTRRYSRSSSGRPGTTILELQLDSTDSVIPLTGGVMRETQQKINALINMDYDTFVNTAFLRQGEADRFTTSTPSERKETLSEVLDLSYYQNLEDLAKQRSREAQTQIVAKDTELSWRNHEIDLHSDLDENLHTTNTSVETFIRDSEHQKTIVENLRSSMGTLRSKKEELQTTVSGISSKKRELQLLEIQVTEYSEQIKEYEAFTSQETEIRQGHAQYLKSQAEQERLGAALGRKNQLDTEKLMLEKEIEVQTERLSISALELNRRISDDLEPQASALGLISIEIQKTDEEETALLSAHNSIEKLRQQSQQISNTIRDLEKENEQLRHSMTDTRKKFDMLDQDGSLCPICNQPVGPEGKQHLRNEFEATGRHNKDSFNSNTEEITTLSIKHSDIVKQISVANQKLVLERQQLSNNKASLQKSYSDATSAKVEIAKIEPDLKQIEHSIKNGDFSHKEKKLLGEIITALDELKYDPEFHQQVREDTRRLYLYDERHRKLVEGCERLPRAHEAFARTNEMLSLRKTEIAQNKLRSETLRRDLMVLESTEQNLSVAEKLFSKLETSTKDLLRQQAVLEQQSKRLSNLEHEIGLLSVQRKRLADQQSVYDELTIAFGKNGIQSLIIETSIPQLESDANEVLMHLTENRMSLKLQLTEGRKSRGGRASEELDIKVADEVGTRSYETYSGGEAFRINFAIRIALSKLLARRAGAPLQTLFVDEGFGSQDSEGQERLIEAIESIKDDFHKIIVITHIERIKEAFPIRIDVIKTESGSTFNIV